MHSIGNIIRLGFQTFLYICMIPFFSIIYSKRNDYSEEELVLLDSPVRFLKISIILLTVKIVFDIHFALASASDL